MTLTKKLASEYLLQLELLRILFFIIRDNCHYFSDQERRDHKLCVKRAQKYLLIQQGHLHDIPFFRINSLPATSRSIQYWQAKKDAIIETRKQLCKMYGHHNVTSQQLADYRKTI